MTSQNNPAAVSPTSPSRHDLRNARFVIALAILAAVLCSNAPVPLLSLYKQQFHFSASTLTTVFVIYAGGVLVPLFLSDRLTRLAGSAKRLVIAALVMVTLGTIIFAFAQSLEWLLVGRLLSGIGTGSIVGPANAALVNTFAPGRRDLGVVWGSVMFTAGATIGPALSGLALAFSFWPTVLPFIVIGLLAAGTAFAIVKMPWPNALPSTLGGGEILADLQTSVSPERRRITFLLAALTVMLSWAIGGILLTLGPLMALQLANIQSRAEVAFIIAAFQGVAGICQIVTARRSPRALACVGVVTMTVAFAGCTLAAWLNLPIVFGLCFIAVGIGNGAAFVGAAGLVIQVAEAAKRSRFISRLYIAAYVGNAIPVVIMGSLVDRFGLLPPMLGFVTLALLGVPVLVSKLRHRTC